MNAWVMLATRRRLASRSRGDCWTVTMGTFELLLTGDTRGGYAQGTLSGRGTRADGARPRARSRVRWTGAPLPLRQGSRQYASHTALVSTIADVVSTSTRACSQAPCSLTRRGSQGAGWPPALSAAGV